MTVLLNIHSLKYPVRLSSGVTLPESVAPNTA